MITLYRLSLSLVHLLLLEEQLLPGVLLYLLYAAHVRSAGPNETTTSLGAVAASSHAPPHI